MNETTGNILEAERGGLIDIGKELSYLLLYGGAGGDGALAASTGDFLTGTSEDKYISPATFFAANVAYTLTDAATVTVNMSYGMNFLLTVAGDRVIDNQTADGMSVVVQGTRTVIGDIANLVVLADADLGGGVTLITRSETFTLVSGAASNAEFTFGIARPITT